MALDVQYIAHSSPLHKTFTSSSLLEARSSSFSPSPLFPLFLQPLPKKVLLDSYEGSRLTNGLPHGTGRAIFQNGCRYSGEFFEGRMDGKGRYEWPDGLVYEGEMLGGEVTGEGVYRWPTGEVYEGEKGILKPNFPLKESLLWGEGSFKLGEVWGRSEMGSGNQKSHLSSSFSCCSLSQVLFPPLYQGFTRRQFHSLHPTSILKPMPLQRYKHSSQAVS